ncbi:MAG: hypothetical protein LDLANPLL_01991 [Turneriella sp.]|nr:hypothetical protein [Turneriella sp.]
MWIKRNIDTILKKEAKLRPAILLTGVRQSGKTSLLHKTFPQAEFVSLDLPSSAEEAEYSGGEFLKKFKRPVIIDEVQYAPKLFRYLKAEIDQKRNKHGVFFLSGSQQMPLMKNVSETMAGRVSILHCMPLSIKELYVHLKRTPKRADVFNFIWQGGYPEVYSRRLDISRFFSDYTATYLERDLRQLIQVRDLRQFQLFMRLCASRIGQLVSSNALASEASVSVNTVQSWLAALEASGILILLRPYYKNLGKRIVKAPKLYFADTGLAAFLNGIQSAEELYSLNMYGQFFENHVVSEAYKAMLNTTGIQNLFYYRDHYGKEVDLVFAKGSSLHLLECKTSENPEKNTAGFIEIEKLIGQEKVLSKTILVPEHGRIKIPETGVTICDSFHFAYWQTNG